MSKLWYLHVERLQPTTPPTTSVAFACQKSTRHQVLTRAGQCGHPEPEGRVLHTVHAHCTSWTSSSIRLDFNFGLEIVMPCPVYILVTIICLSEDCQKPRVTNCNVINIWSKLVWLNPDKNKFQISKQVHVYRTWLVISHMYVETIKRGRHWCHCLVWNYGWSSNSVKAKIAEVTKHSMWTAVQNGWNSLMNFYLRYKLYIYLKLKE